MKRYSRPLGLVPTVLLGLACSVAVTLFALWAHPVSVLAMLGKMLHQPLILLLNWLPVALLTGAFAFAFRSAFWGARSGSLPISDQLYIIQHNIIKDLAEKERCVIVGRCADYVLRDRPDCLHTFFHADTAFRADRIVRLYGERPEKPEKRLKEKDDKRRAYYRHYTGHQWGLAENYDICLDSGRLGIDQCVDILVNAAKA